MAAIEEIHELDQPFQILMQEGILRGRSGVLHPPDVDGRMNFRSQDEIKTCAATTMDAGEKLRAYCNGTGQAQDISFQSHAFPGGGRLKAVYGGTGGYRGEGQTAATGGYLVAQVHAAHVQENKGGPCGSTQLAISSVLSSKSRDHFTNKYSWIIDTGATHHVSGDRTLFVQLRPIDDCPIGLPDGCSSFTTHSRTVILSGNLRLLNVLYVPELNCNLISASQFLDDHNCMMQLTDRLCIMQDRVTRTLIGLGERVDGLFWFVGVPEARVLAIDGAETVDL